MATKKAQVIVLDWATVFTTPEFKKAFEKFMKDTVGAKIDDLREEVAHVEDRMEDAARDAVQEIKEEQVRSIVDDVLSDARISL